MLMISVFILPHQGISSGFLTPSLWSPLTVALLSPQIRAEYSPAAFLKLSQCSPLEGLSFPCVPSTATWVRQSIFGRLSLPDLKTIPLSRTYWVVSSADLHHFNGYLTTPRASPSQ
ncbi:hypothetical protein Pcinc_007415 [Petrolisthes cinctipes]|uniref:Uncharacterized protein n=1 Tax=Petrolisthes cinctipes TaxID=88211 RepID=A0AAE1KY79_PETCI|nr:hypothetical protein Pcinc_007415 [Petrolisthes cinctipes]